MTPLDTFKEKLHRYEKLKDLGTWDSDKQMLKNWLHAYALACKDILEIRGKDWLNLSCNTTKRVRLQTQLEEVVELARKEGILE